MFIIEKTWILIQFKFGTFDAKLVIIQIGFTKRNMLKFGMYNQKIMITSI
jgi:hypothetical protein